MTRYFVYLAIIIVNFFIANRPTFGYEYKIEHFNHSMHWLKGPVDTWWLKRNNFTEIKHVDFLESKKLCTAASENATLDFYNNTNDRTLYRYFLNSQYPRAPVIKCSTMPPSYLRIDQSSNDTIIIMMESNKYEDIKFWGYLVRPEFEPKSCNELLRDNREKVKVDQHEVDELTQSQSTCDLDRKLQKSRLSKFSNHERLDVCMAAKSYLVGRKHNVPGRLPKFQEYNVELAQLFNIKSKTGYVKRVAIRCPTTPRMYVYFSDSRINADLKILLVQEAINAKN